MWGTPISVVYLGHPPDLIDIPKVRDPLRKAENEYAQGNVEGALEKIEEAFHEVWEHAKKAGAIFTQAPFGGSALHPSTTVGSVLDKDDVVWAINLVLLGVDLPTYSLYRRLAPGVARSPYTGTTQVQWWRKPEATPEEFDRILNFVTDLALRVMRIAAESPNVLTTGRHP